MQTTGRGGAPGTRTRILTKIADFIGIFGENIAIFAIFAESEPTFVSNQRPTKNNAPFT